MVVEEEEEEEEEAEVLCSAYDGLLICLTPDVVWITLTLFHVP